MITAIKEARQFIDRIEGEENRIIIDLARRIADGEDVKAEEVSDACPTQAEIDVLERQVKKLKEIRMLVSVAKNEDKARKEQHEARANVGEYHERKKALEKSLRLEYAALKKASRQKQTLVEEATSARVKLNGMLGVSLVESLQAATVRVEESEKAVTKEADALERQKLARNNPEATMEKITKRIAILQREKEHSSDHSMELRSNLKDGHYLMAEYGQPFRKESKAELAELLALKEKITGKTHEQLIAECETALKSAKAEAQKAKRDLAKVWKQVESV